MRWLLSKIDSLIGTILAATVGLGGTQFLAFVQQYRQRLEGHLNEAELRYREVLEGDLYRGVDEATRNRFAEAAADRIEELKANLTAIVEANIWSKPWVFMDNLDRDMALATLKSFQPALPLDGTSVAYGLAGMVLAWLAYEVVKFPLALMGRRSS